MYHTLKEGIYPDLTRLDIAFNGIELSQLPAFSTEFFRVEYRVGRAESVVPTLSASNSIAIIMQPGLSSNVDSWNAALRLLVQSKVPTIVTGYSNVGDRLTSDSVFDERIMSSYFLANILVPTTSNPCSINHGQYRKMAFYFAFQGPTEDPTAKAISRVQLQADNQRAFVEDLIYVALKFDGNPSLSRRSEKVLKLIDSGKSPFAPMATMHDVDVYLVNGRF